MMTAIILHKLSYLELLASSIFTGALAWFWPLFTTISVSCKAVVSSQKAPSFPLSEAIPDLQSSVATP
jgi:hypothetical protein